MNILADQNIPFVLEACRLLGDVTLFDSTDLVALKELLRTADILLCRSTIRLDRNLLQSTPVRFVATATSGTEHMDKEFLQEAGIRYADAAGSNAQSVAEYVFTALFSLASERDFSLQDKSIGIIGVGHVGTWVAHIAEQLGMRLILNDPPLQEKSGSNQYSTFNEALTADIVSVHVPLTGTGKYPTRHLIDEHAFAAMKQGAVFINTARGDVVDPIALTNAASSNKFKAIVLDVFPHEPAIDPSLVSIADIATPHIAGHSFDGKVLGTQMIYERLCSFLEKEPEWNYLSVLPPSSSISVKCNNHSSREREVQEVLKTMYDIKKDAAALQSIIMGDPRAIGKQFSGYRNNYPVRREFHTYSFELSEIHPEVAATLLALGLQQD